MKSKPKSQSFFLLFFLSISIFPVAVQSDFKISEIANWIPVHGGGGGGSEFHTSPSSRSLLSLNNINNPKRDITLVAFRDGTAYLVDQKSGDVLFTIPTGSSISSLDQTHNGDDKENNSLMDLDDMFTVDIGEGFVHTEDRGELNLMQIVEDLYNNGIPYISKDKALVGQKKSTIFIIDLHNHRIVNVIDINGDNNALPEAETTDSENAQSLYVVRTDYGLLHAPRDLKRHSWKFKFSRLEAYFLEQEREQQVPVVHVRDGAHVRFLLEISRLNYTAAKPFLAPEGNKNSTSITSIVDAGSMGESSTQPFTGESEQNTNYLVSVEDGSHKNSNEKKIPIYTKLLYITILCLILVLISLGIGFITISKQKSTTELTGSSGKDNTDIKKKKTRKSAHNKVRASIKSNTGNISYDDAKRLNEPSSNKRNGNEPWSKFEIPVNAEANGRRIGKLFISNTEIAKGSNGTVVMEGIYDGRPVAVKRLVQAHHDVAYKEIQNLIASDQHQNIVRWYGVEYDSDFVYLSLERCICSLGDLIKINSDYPNHSTSTQVKCVNSAKKYNIQSGKSKVFDKHLELWKANGYPAPQLLKLMRDMVAGLVHLHELGIIHRDLKPQNILINNEKSLCAKLSDMGISKRLPEDKSSLGHRPTGYGSSGWQAPEQLLHGRQTRAVDLFGLGCVLFYCITGGGHPYGDHLERDINIVKNKVDLFMVEHIPEAMDLFIHLLNPDPELRPTASYVLQHPLFWNSETRLSFLRDTSDRVELEDREIGSDLLKALENVAPVALGGNWDEKMEAIFIDNIGRYRRYKFDSIRDLLRVVRNKLNHYRELPKEIQDLLGPVPVGFDGYFTSKFPKLLIEVYKVMYSNCREEECFWKYFRTV